MNFFANDPVAQDYILVKTHLDEREKRRDAIEGKHTPFRVESRYKGGSQRWNYFTNLNEAQQYKDIRIGYNVWGRAAQEKPYWEQVQCLTIKGKWVKWTKDVSVQLKQVSHDDDE
jgi:hypothetical protein